MIKSKFFFPSFLLLISFLIFFRSPCFFIEDGYWQISKDGYFNFSTQNDFLKSSLYVLPFGGYFEFARNIISKIASYYPFFSQKIDTYFSLLIYLVIFSYTYISNSLFLNNHRYKILFISLILFSPIMTPEIWLTIAHVKTYFGIFVFLLLFQDDRHFTIQKKITYRIGIIFCGLSSIYASVMAPIFFLKFLIEKTKDSFLNFLFLFFTLIINVFIFFVFFAQEEPARFTFDFGKIESFSYNILIRPFFGSSIPTFLYNKFSIISNETIFISIVLIIVICITLLYKTFQKKDKLIVLITASFILQSIFVLIGSLYPNFVGGRYAVIPGIILLSLFIRFYQLESNFFFKYLFGFFILVSLMIGLIEFKYFSPLPYILACNM